MERLMGHEGDTGGEGRWESMEERTPQQTRQKVWNREMKGSEEGSILVANGFEVG